MRSCDEERVRPTTASSLISSLKLVDHTGINSKNSRDMSHSENNGKHFHEERPSKIHYYNEPRKGSATMLSLHNRNSKNPTGQIKIISTYVDVGSHWSKIDRMNDGFLQNGLIGSILCEEGHIYSLAADGDLLFTGSDGNIIRVWKSLMEFSGFKSGSGLVKAIVLSNDKIFTGHQDGKIRVWSYSHKDPAAYKRVGVLPDFKELVKKSLNPKNYVEVRRQRNGLRIRHYDAVSCMSLNEEQGLLYSGSWDRTLKVWRVSDSKCVDSVNAHDDAVNAVVAGFDALVFSGSADGTIKVWRREFNNLVNPKSTGSITHALQQILLKQESAVTALAANPTEGWLYSGASDGLVNFWECGGKKLRHGGVLKGHKLAVLCLEACGSLVFSGGADKSICVWLRRCGGVHSCHSVLSGHTGPVKCLAVQELREEDRAWVVYSGSLDKSVKVWRVSERLPDF